jgi:hypothetical protein
VAVEAAGTLAGAEVAGAEAVVAEVPRVAAGVAVDR